MVWNPMLLAQYVIVHRDRRPPADRGRRAPRMVRHFEVTRTPDGGWGMHPEAPGYVFFTDARLRGAAAARRPGRTIRCVARRARWLHAQPGGVLAIPTLGQVLARHRWASTTTRA